MTAGVIIVTVLAGIYMFYILYIFSPFYKPKKPPTAEEIGEAMSNKREEVTDRYVAGILGGATEKDFTFHSRYPDVKPKQQWEIDAEKLMKAGKDHKDHIRGDHQSDDRNKQKHIDNYYKNQFKYDCTDCGKSYELFADTLSCGCKDVPDIREAVVDPILDEFIEQTQELKAKMVEKVPPLLSCEKCFAVYDLDESCPNCIPVREPVYYSASSNYIYICKTDAQVEFCERREHIIYLGEL